MRIHETIADLSHERQHQLHEQPDCRNSAAKTNRLFETWLSEIAAQYPGLSPSALVMRSWASHRPAALLASCSRTARANERGGTRASAHGMPSLSSLYEYPVAAEMQLPITAPDPV